MPMVKSRKATTVPDGTFFHFKALFFFEQGLNLSRIPQNCRFRLPYAWYGRPDRANQSYLD